MEILFGIISSCIYSLLAGLGKYLGQTYIKAKLQREIEEYVRATLRANASPAACERLEDFFSLPQMKDILSDYILYAAIGGPEGQHGRFYSRAEFLGIIEEKYAALYGIRGDSPLLGDCCELIFNFCTKKIYLALGKRDQALVFLINSGRKEEFTLLDDHLDRIETKLKQLLGKGLEEKNPNFDLIRDNYHKKLQERNCEAHIYLLDKFPFHKFYVPPVLGNDVDTALFADSEVLRRDFMPTTWDKIFQRRNIVYIVGGAGYGKTLFLKKLVNDYRLLSIADPEDYLVIYGELKMFYANKSEIPMSVDDFLISSIKCSTLVGESITPEFIHHYLTMGRCLILLDALDEVDKEKREDLHEKLIAYFRSENPNNKICITSRDRGFIPEKNIEVYHIQPLSHREIETYVDNIIRLGKFDREDKKSFMEQAAALTRKGFLSSFLALSLLLSIYKAERELPENKLDLYGKCFEYITVKREKEKTRDKFDWQKISILMKQYTFMALSQLCYPNNCDAERSDIVNALTKIYRSKYSNENETVNAVDEFLAFCTDRTELFVPSNGDDKFKFFHRSFFEYFYSLHLFVNYTDAPALIEKFKGFDVDSEVFELTMSMLKQQAEDKYQDVLRLLFERAEEELKTRTTPVCLNILILIMPIVDDVQYRNAFYGMVIERRKEILRQKNRIHGLLSVLELLGDSDGRVQAICDAYYADFLEELTKRLSVLVDLCEEQKKDKHIALNVYYNRRYPTHRYFFYAFLVRRVDLEELLASPEKWGEHGPSKEQIDLMRRLRDLDQRTQAHIVQVLSQA